VKIVQISVDKLGHADISATSNYLGIEDSDALEVARNHHI